MLPKELQDLVKQLPAESQLVIHAVVVYFEQKLNEQASRIKELEDQISKNSRNSSKPPSTDQFKDSDKKPRTPKSLRSKTNRKSGGQQGHKGNTLKMIYRR